MKILLISPKFYPENFSSFNIAKELVNLGHEVTVFTGSFENSKLKTYEEINNVKIYRNLIYKNKSKLLTRIRNYFHFVKCGKQWVKKCKEKYDVVYSFQISPVIMLNIGKAYAKKFNVKHIGHILDLWPDSVVETGYTHKCSPLYIYLNQSSKGLYNSLDHIVIGSPSFKEYFLEKFINKKECISYIPQPSIIEYKENKENVSKGLNVVYCGNIGTLQNIELLVKAAKELKNDNIFFHIVGTGFNAKNIIKFINDNSLTNVRYYGWKNADESAAIIKECDLCFLYLKEGGFVGRTIPNKMMMYMALSKPILAVTEGDAKDIINKANGGFFAENNTESITKTIKEISLINKAELIQKGVNNFKYYNNNFKVNKIAKELLVIFSK